MTTIIRDCSMDNTYKMSWIRSIVEYSSKNPSTKKIYFDDLSQLIFKYYWNQTIFFNLEQGSNPNKKPEIYQLVVNEIEKYNQIFNNKDIWITEWNLQMTKTTGNTLLQSLFVSQYYLELFSNPDLKNIKISTYHNLAGRDVSGSIFMGSKNGFETHSTYYPLTFLGKIFENDIIRIEKEVYNEVFIYKCYDINGKNKISFEIDWEEKTFSYN